MTLDPLWDQTLTPSYPGWMGDEQGQVYEQEVAERFVTAMSALAASVFVVAAASPLSGRTGITATAVCSLSTQPPQVVACVNRTTSIARVLNDTGWFSVNLLSADHEELAGTFAGRSGLSGDDRFDDALWSTHVTGTPVLREAAATCVCHVSASLQQATHLIVVGAVLDVLIAAEPPPLPLIYHNRRFTTLQSATPLPATDSESR